MSPRTPLSVSPGRFLTLTMLYLGGLLVLQFGLAVLAGAVDLRSVYPYAALLAGIGPFLVGVHRLRNPSEEARPAAYGAWAVLLGILLVVLTGWLAVLVVDWVGG